MIERVNHSIRKQKQQIAGGEVDGAYLKFRVEIDAERDAAGFKAHDAAIPSAKNRVVVASVYEFQVARRRIVFGEKGGGKTAAIEAVSGGIAIEPRNKFGERNAFAGNGAQARLKRGHEQRGGDTFSGDVGDHQKKFFVSTGIAKREKRVVVIAGNGILRPRGKRNVRVRYRGRLRRYQPRLDFARDFEVALHGDFVREFQGKQEQEDQRGKEFKPHLECGLAGKLKLESRRDQQNESDHEKHSTHGAQFVEHCRKHGACDV